jgi:hypothetical protein
MIYAFLEILIVIQTVEEFLPLQMNIHFNPKIKITMFILSSAPKPFYTSTFLFTIKEY